MNEIDIARHSRLIDPQLHVWGWEIPVYLFLGGMAAGLMILSALLWMWREERSSGARWLAFAAPLLVTVGMGALFLDLALKAHVWRFYLAFRWTSPMSWGAWILVLVYPVSIVAALGGLGEAQADRAIALCARLGLGAVARRARALGAAHAAAIRWASVAAGAGLGVYTGVLLSTLGARALWSSALLGPLFLISGVSTAAALMLLFRLSDDERHLVATWDRIAIALELVTLLLVLAGLTTGGAHGKAAVELLLGGPFTAPFWALVIAGGLVVPLLLGILEGVLRLRTTVAGPVLVLAGGLALRWILVAAGQA